MLVVRGENRKESVFKVVVYKMWGSRAATNLLRLALTFKLQNCGVILIRNKMRNLPYYKFVIDLNLHDVELTYYYISFVLK